MNVLPKVFEAQAQACAALGSPFTARLCRALPTLLEGRAIGARLSDWPGDPGPGGASLPLRLTGALHALKLDGDEGLTAIYPSNAPSDAEFAAGLSRAFDQHATPIDAFINRPPQTNEVRRAAVLIAAASVIADRFGLPLRLSELGASGGLNLNFDQFALTANGWTLGPTDPALTLTPDWTGAPPPDVPFTVVQRRGVDLTPLDPVADRLRLLAYLWPDQPERLSLTRAALTLPPAPVDAADAGDWLPARLGATPGQAHLIYHTIAWQYFPADVQARLTQAIEAAGVVATPDAPLALASMENDNGAGGDGAALTLRLWPGDETLKLGRADFHGRWIRCSL